MKIQKLIDILEKSWDILEKSPDEKMLPAMKILYQHLKNPQSYVTLVGETSSGKSTLINSLLQKKLLMAKAKPTTGTVTWLEYDISKQNQFLAINRDATIEQINYEEFLTLSEQPDDNLLRLKAEVKGTKKEFNGLSLFDTPGYNSIILNHEEVLKEFLPESDVIVFPVSYRVGFGNNDQQLMSLIYDIGQKFGEIPVILVVNRAPIGITEKDKRIQEIKLHAEDSLHSSVVLNIINTTELDENGNSPLPITITLWNNVAAIAFSEQRMSEFSYKARIFIQSFIAQRITEINGAFLAMNKGKDATKILNEELSEIQNHELKSYAIVDKYMERLKREIPRILQSEINTLKSAVKNEIKSSSKWADHNQCRNYIGGHAIPFGAKKSINKIENYIYEEFQHMDTELDEVANDVIFNLEKKVQATSNPEIKDLLLNVSSRIASKLTGIAASSFLNKMGGACGSSAGLGNLVKTTLKNVGKIFGKKFSKEVYTKIGKIFTAKFVKYLNVGLTVLLELGDYVLESATWQNKLIEKSNQSIDMWQNSVLEEFLGKMIDNYKTENYKNVEEVYNNIKLDIQASIDDSMRQYSQSDINIMQGEKLLLSEIQKELEV